MAFKPWCEECQTWHSDLEGHIGKPVEYIDPRDGPDDWEAPNRVPRNRVQTPGVFVYEGPWPHPFATDGVGYFEPSQLLHKGRPKLERKP